ncbi:MAG: DUF951 domain-containing protein [Clostridiaceae bacterium]|nr:DUF951 domain-containing protein [Clostridiaceae bacterium]
MPMKLFVGDIIELKKQHPCGSKQWKILRAGMDFRIQCLGCNHQVMMPRPNLEKRIKKVISSQGEEKGDNIN